MRRRVHVITLALAALLAASVQADLIVTLSPKDASLSPVAGSVPAGTKLLVDILLSVDGADDPLVDLRGLTLDFSATDAALSLGTFAWDLDGSAYGFQTSTLPVPWAVSLLMSSDPRLLVLDGEPQRVATVEVTVNGDGTLNAVGSLDVGQGSGAQFDYGFDPPMPPFSLSAGNLRGGTIELTISAPTPSDTDGDGVPNTEDAFPQDPTESVDTDEDGVGNNGDSDDDGDGAGDAQDAFPVDPAETTDADGDEVGDNTDAFPDDPTETVDTDNDGLGDNSDVDDDGDGVADSEDAFPLDPAEAADTDGDGVGDDSDPDDDGDDVADSEDAFPLDPTESMDTDNDGIGDHADSDDGGDGGGGDTGGDTGTGAQPGTRMCGAAMVPPLLLTFCCLSLVRMHRRRP